MNKLAELGNHFWQKLNLADVDFSHRRRIQLEDNANVVASVRGTESLPPLAVLPRSIWNKRLSIPNRPADFNRLCQIDKLSLTVCGAK